MREDEDKRVLPEGWKWVRLGDVCTIITGKLDANASSEDGIYPFFTCASEPLRINRFSYDCECVLVAGNGDLNVKYYSGKFDAYQRTYIIQSKINDIINVKFLYYFLNIYIEHLRKIRVGGIVQYIKLGNLTDAQIPLPPLAEQQKIAALLTEQLATVERARTAAEQQLKDAKALPAAFLREVFESEEARGWETKRLGDFLRLRKDIIHPRDEPKGAATFVGLEHVEPNTGIRIGSVDLEMSDLKGRKPKFYLGDIVYGYLRPYLNKVWIAEFEGLCSVDQYVYETNPSHSDVQFLAWFMRSPTYLERAPIDASPGQLPRIRTEEVASVMVNMPSIEKQKVIAQTIIRKMAQTEVITSHITKQLADINKLPAELLRVAFSGESI